LDCAENHTKSSGGILYECFQGYTELKEAEKIYNRKHRKECAVTEETEAVKRNYLSSSIQTPQFDEACPDVDTSTSILLKN
jgi:hypothetical protein